MVYNINKSKNMAEMKNGISPGLYNHAMSKEGVTVWRVS